MHQVLLSPISYTYFLHPHCNWRVEVGMSVEHGGVLG